MDEKEKEDTKKERDEDYLHCKIGEWISRK